MFLLFLYTISLDSRVLPLVVLSKQGHYKPAPAVLGSFNHTSPMVYLLSKELRESVSEGPFFHRVAAYSPNIPAILSTASIFLTFFLNISKYY
jgi:hypothetical protein